MGSAISQRDSPFPREPAHGPTEQVVSSGWAVFERISQATAPGTSGGLSSFADRRHSKSNVCAIRRIRVSSVWGVFERISQATASATSERTAIPQTPNVRHPCTLAPHPRRRPHDRQGLSWLPLPAMRRFVQLGRFVEFGGGTMCKIPPLSTPVSLSSLGNSAQCSAP